MFGRTSLAMNLQAAKFRPVRIHRLRRQVMRLVLALDAADFADLTGFDRDFEAIEAQTAHAQFEDDYSTALSADNRHKNRYSNVLPPEATRVRLSVLKDADEGESDYINANDITGRTLPRRVAEAHARDVQANNGVDLHPWHVPRYIATQGPLEWTIADFWRMVWERNVSVVVMLTKEVENGRVKCDRYWPEAESPLTLKRFRVEPISCEESEELLTRRLRLVDIRSGDHRIITQFQYTAWPDHGLPPSTTAYLELSHLADQANTTQGPLVVHCSAGIGRSGTFCAVHSSVELIEWQVEEQVRKHGRIVDPPLINIGKTVLHLREQRPGMIQTREQFFFCYLAIMEESERLLDEFGGDDASEEAQPMSNSSSSSSNSSSGAESDSDSDDISMSEDG